jgi:hypothetical protein
MTPSSLPLSSSRRSMNGVSTAFLPIALGRRF